MLIEAVAGLALLGTLGAALRAAVADEEQREAAIITFVVCASGVTVLGISAPFWGLVAGLLLMPAACPLPSIARPRSRRDTAMTP